MKSYCMYKESMKRNKCANSLCWKIMEEFRAGLKYEGFLKIEFLYVQKLHKIKVCLYINKYKIALSYK